MSTFKEIQGRNIKSVSSDPANAGAGDIWYNSTSSTLKGVVMTEGWSSGGSLGTGRYLGAAFGTVDAGVYMGGMMSPTPVGPASDLNEEYNGIGWSSGTSYPASVIGAGSAGTQTDGLCFGGGQPPFKTAANKYDGTSWTGTGAIPLGADNFGSCGTDTTSNVIAAIGRNPSSGNAGTNTSIKFNGSTWSAGPTLNTARMFGANMGAGTGTAGLVFGGFIDPSPNSMTNTESFDGTSWTTVTSLNRAMGLRSGLGIQTSALAVCGNTPSGVGAEHYDGTSWTIKTDMPTGESYCNSSGSTGTSGFVTGIGPTRQTTVEYNKSTDVITPGAWASAPALNTARSAMTVGTIGTPTSALAVGGYIGPPRSNLTEEYDGSSWTVQNVNPATLSGRGGTGTQTAALTFGGNPDPSTVTTTTEYDGANWTVGGVLTNARGYGPIGAGTQTAGMAIGGYNPPVTYVTAVEFYDGGSWSTNPVTGPSIYGGAGSGTQAAAWSYVMTAVANIFGGGPTTTAWVSGGDADPGLKVATNTYDGTAWSTAPNMATARSYGTQTGANTASLAIGGGTPGATTTVEQFTGQTSTTNIKTITTS